MLGRSFSEEWLTVCDHRVLLTARDGPPCSMLRRAAMIAVWSLEFWGSDGDMRLASVFYDNRHTSHLDFTFGAVVEDPDDDDSTHRATDAVKAVESVFSGLGYSLSVVQLRPGPRHSDSYNHTEYLTLGAIEQKGRKVEISL